MYLVSCGTVSGPSRRDVSLFGVDKRDEDLDSN